jgi:hypothetical protein
VEDVENGTGTSDGNPRGWEGLTAIAATRWAGKSTPSRLLSETQDKAVNRAFKGSQRGLR